MKQYTDRQRKLNLYECHGHIMMDGNSFSDAVGRHSECVDTDTVKSHLKALAESGVVYFRDGGDALGVSAYAATIASDYGIAYATPLFAIHKKGRYGGIVGREYSDLKEYELLVNTVRTGGGGFIKIMISGIITFKEYGQLSCPSLPSDEIRDLINIAHDAGLPVMAHTNGSGAVRSAVSAGADSIEHGAFMDEETVSILADSDTVWVPTAAAIAAFTRREGVRQDIAEKTLEKHLECVKRASDMGACIAAGSDSGAPGVPHGKGALEEYGLLIRAGLSEKKINQGSERIARIFSPLSSACV